MHEIYCECGELVASGEIAQSTRTSKVTGNPHTHTAFIVEGQVRGMILKNGSENPRKWKGKCSRCQSNSAKENVIA